MKWIDKCLESLKNSSVKVGIIIVDNHSNDGTEKHIELNYPDVHLIKSKVNLGFGKGNNMGILYALEKGADQVFLLNQDARVDPSALSELSELLYTNKAYGILSPLHLNGEGNALEYYFSTCLNAVDCPDYISDMAIRKELKSIYPVKFVNAAAWVISAECLNKVGIFDPIFNHYVEDEDYMLRIKYFGYMAGICPTAFIYHDASKPDWEKIKKNFHRRKLHYILQLKQINSSFRSNVLKFIKSSFDHITGNLLYRKFGEAWMLTRIFIFIIFHLHKIKKSRKDSLKESAFISEK